MAEEEVKIGDKKLGLGTEVKLNIKTIFVIIGLLWGGLSSIATVGYFNLKSEIQQEKKELLAENELLKEKLVDEVTTSLRFVREDIKSIIREQGEQKGDLKVLLSKTRDIHTQVDNHHNIGELEEIIIVPHN